MTDSTPARVAPTLTRADSIHLPGAFLDEQGRPEPPLVADEWHTLTGFLEYQRSTLHWKCSGLDASDLQVRVAASTMTLGGLLKHLAWVEDHWFAEMFQGTAMPEPWASVNWADDQDWEWNSATGDTASDVFTLWQRSVAHSRRATEQAPDHTGLDTLAARAWPDGQQMSLRWILVHMIEEYARHNGHADLIRESIDGATGE